MWLVWIRRTAVFFWRSAIHGGGVFAVAVAARGEPLVEYKGGKLSEHEANRRFAHESRVGQHALLELSSRQSE